MRSNAVRGMLFAFTTAFAIGLAGTVDHTSVAHAQDPATAVVGGIVGKVLLDDAEQKARDLLQQAKSTGDYLLWQFATNMLNLVEKARAEASGLLNETVEKIGSERNKTFFQIHELTQKAEVNLQEAYLKADELTANFAETIGRIPLVDDSADLFAIQPSALPPLSVEKIVRFIGPGMGAAEAVATLPSGKVVPLTAEKATSAYLKLVPLDFASQDGKANFFEVKVEYVKSSSGWWCFWCSDEKVQRVVPIVVPHIVPGKVRLVHFHDTSETVKDGYLVPLNTAGKRIEVGHPVVVPPNFKDSGFEIDGEVVVASMQPGGKKLVNRVWGYSGSCNGPNLATLRNDGFVYNVYAGATCNAFGCKGGNQTCEITVPLKKTVTKTVESAGEFQNLSWLEPTILQPDITAKNVLLELEKPDGSRVRFSPTERILAVTVTTEPSDGAFRVVPFIGLQ